VPIAQSAISEIVNTETEYLKTRQGDYQREKASLERSVRQEDDEIGVLSKQEKQEEQGVQADVEDLRKVNELMTKGTTVTTRVTDARRAVLLSSTRKLQITAQLMLAKQKQDEFGRKLEKLDDQRRIDLLHDLQEATVQSNEIREKLQGVGDKLQYTSMVRSQLVQGVASKPKITIVRKGEKGQEKIVASEDTELQPGDAVEVALPYMDNPDSPLPKAVSANMPLPK
jgi:polysaccharide export outer membrane protein